MRDQDHLNQAQAMSRHNSWRMFATGQAYTPLSTFKAQFNNGNNAAVNFSKAAEAMSGQHRIGIKGSQLATQRGLSYHSPRDADSGNCLARW